MKKYLVIILSAILMLSGCKDFLVKEPFLSQSTEMALIDFNGLNKAVAGAYSPLVDGNWYGADFVLNGEMMSENASRPVSTDFQSGRFEPQFTMTFSPTNTSGLWQYAYFVISAANNVIDQVATMGMDYYATGGATAQDVNNLLGECYFLRALAHFDLQRIYGYSVAKAKRKAEYNQYGIPVIEHTDGTCSEQPARNKVDSVFTCIEADLKTAEQLMDPSYVRSGVSDKRATATRTAVQALLSRVYLYDMKWQDAADYATKVINTPTLAGSPLTLWTEDEYCGVWGAKYGSGEVIFEVYGSQSNDFDEYWEGPSHMTNPKGYADVCASPSLVKLYGEGDVRGTEGIRGEDDGEVMFCTDAGEKSGGELWTMKYFGKGEGDAVATPDVNNVIVLRLSEMYLNRAEAIANGAVVSGVTAKEDINTIRAGRGAAPEMSEPALGTILSERRKELAFEGHYWFDLARTDSGLDGYKDERRPKIDLGADAKYWALPIPRREFEVNKNLVQNPGWGQ